jgi:hypothetical protein
MLQARICDWSLIECQLCQFLEMMQRLQTLVGDPVGPIQIKLGQIVEINQLFQTFVCDFGAGKVEMG